MEYEVEGAGPGGGTEKNLGERLCRKTVGYMN